MSMGRTGDGARSWAMGSRPGSVRWPLCGLQYYHIERKVVFELS